MVGRCSVYVITVRDVIYVLGVDAGVEDGDVVVDA